jgi:catechol 2,3-dioxygenase-like lactoylglutathione lyase family enzyme
VTPLTRGLHHLGLTVSKLEESAAFFTQVLGWKEVKRDPDYPAVFVSDGAVTVTLWKNQQEPAAPFDRARTVGLQHAAFAVDSEQALLRLHQRLIERGVPVQFPPQPRQAGGSHLFCFEPSGIRLEFLWPGA